ncbi:hypothetical protein KCP75_16375 [Salmonella enterica subsp. enterica]|nr:hypothetical protein KCP75_16375 [Salmonella enterica subsp. enterica]
MKGAAIARNFSLPAWNRRDEHSAFILSYLSPDYAEVYFTSFAFVIPLCGRGRFLRSLPDNNAKSRNSLFYY